VRDASDDEAGWCLVAEAFSALGEHERSLKAAEYAVRAHPYDAEGHLWKCRALLALERKDAALNAAQAGLEQSHYDHRIRRLLVRAQLACGRTVEALVELGQLQARFPEDSEIDCLTGELALVRERDSEAEAAFRAAVERERDCEAGWVGLAQVRGKRGLRLDAAHCYYEAGRANPQDLSYRSRGVAALDELVDQRLGLVPAIYYTFTFIVGGLFCVAYPFLIPVVIALMVWGGRALGAWTLEGILKTLVPEVGDYYRRVYPLQRAQNAKDTREGCLILLGLLGGVLGLWELTRRGLWELTLRLLVVSALTIPWLWKRFAPRRREPKPEPPLFRFPDEVLVGEEAPRVAPAAEPLEIAWTQFSEGKAAAARETARILLAQQPEDVHALRIYSLASLAAGDGEAGLEAAQRARQVDPAAPDLRALLWLQLAAAERSDEALHEAERDPGERDACLEMLVELVGYLEAAGAAEPVAAGSRLVRELAPGSPQAWKLVGDTAYRGGRWHEAEAAYRQALALAPESSLYLSQLGAVLAQQHRYREAWALWDRALRADPEAEWAAANLDSQLRWALIISAAVVAVILGSVAFLPTFYGQLRNPWMPWATFAGPFVTMGACALLYRPWKRLIGPSLPRSQSPDWPSLLFTTVVMAAIVLLPLHAIQTWTEIAMHPGLFAARWQGAATITLLAGYCVITALRTFGIVKSQEEPTVGKCE
jgi:tetratricopeptide (TPR) repeat protein